ncbi:hypothetical protein Mkiyose1665_14050 [Mycobacterium kiyosense]|uniref:Uncharacterized protein n=1 Tax=Mycobacterium kiyosense TaxID=2871094 RepID=A0A9P3Q728_9MYCO|nr:hypothetical protein IWGMT90018_01920 [Mycobacterium kiyosense]BDE11601.1 hypothetical protein MKCMC460_04610 [Mycobacterium sp. 20KCMC460]GLB81879.1 hypothetical protein SRL2020028_11350 [Mycobacterium kiyosense]GLB88161.1 hypothetical protein SRL2020130_09780 [Mycobacterium kiyosense]GLB95721.1 hypothetical protein SRL2020226_24970 [Mycobacterium kiyosense]
MQGFTTGGGVVGVRASDPAGRVGVGGAGQGDDAVVVQPVVVRDRPQLLTLDLSHDLHHPPIDGIALPGQLRQLLKQPLQTLRRSDRHRLNKGRRRHNPIKTGGTDNQG